MCPNTYSKPSLGWSKKRTGGKHKTMSKAEFVPWTLPCVNSTCRTQSAHCTVLVQWKSKTILPKCVACSVPQYNKPNARGACESGSLFIFDGRFSLMTFTERNANTCKGSWTNSVGICTTDKHYRSYKHRCQTKQRVSTTHDACENPAIV